MQLCCKAHLGVDDLQKREPSGGALRDRLQEALKALRELQSGLNRYQLKTCETIKQKIQKILKEHLCEKWIHAQIHSHTQSHIRHSRRGRPRPDVTGKVVQTEYFSISFELNQEAIRQESLTDGIFPLITNIYPEYTARKILEIYKFQPFLEKRHSQLKTYQEVMPVLLKKSERVVALLHIHVIALMVSTLIERKLRLAMKKQSIPSLPIYPEGKPCKYPTLFDVVRLFRGVERYEMEKEEEIELFPAKLNGVQKKVLELLEVPVSGYQ